MKNAIIVVLCVVIAVSIGLSFYTILTRGISEEQNPNVVLVTTPEQENFEAYSK